MTYIPTTTELEDMGFTNFEDFPRIYILTLPDQKLCYSFMTDKWNFGYSYIYPQSRQDIETLIRLFTKP